MVAVVLVVVIMKVVVVVDMDGRVGSGGGDTYFGLWLW